MTTAFEAMIFAHEVHAGQKRRYASNAYTDHLAEVAGIVATVVGSWSNPSEMIAAAWLHDTVEDQGVAVYDLQRKFGTEVARGVEQLSDLEVGSRKERKAASNIRLSGAAPWLQTVKLADVISNLRGIRQADPKFAEIYLEEKRQLLAVMVNGDTRLYQLAQSLAAA